MGQLFSTSKGSKVTSRDITDTDRAILQLKTNLRKLNVEHSRLERLIDRCVEIAKELVKEHKRDRALLTLQQKRVREQQLAQVQATILNVTGVLSNIEAQRQANVVFEALRQGTDALKALQREVTLEDVEKLREDTDEAYQVQTEMQERLGTSLMESGIDMQDLYKELDQMEGELAELFKLEEMPTAPTKSSVAAATEPVPTAAQQANSEEVAIPVAVPLAQNPPTQSPAVGTDQNQVDAMDFPQVPTHQVVLPQQEVEGGGAAAQGGEKAELVPA